MLTRRQLLASLAGITTLVTVGGVTSLLPGEPADGYLLLDAEAIRITEKIAEAVIGPDWHIAPVIQELDKTLSALPEVGKLWRYLPAIVEQLARTETGGTAFSDLSVAERQRVLMVWASSRTLEKRQIYHGLRDLLLSHFYFQPQSWAAIAYGGPWVGRIPMPPHPLRFPVDVEA